MHCYSKLSLLALASVASVVSARPSAPAHIGARGSASSTEACTNGKAIYVTSNTVQNAVVALPIAQNGSLLVAQGSSTSTGGTGASGLSAGGSAAGPDSLFSQSAIAIAGSYLFAVNPGSNTVTMLAIDAQDPTKLTVIGSPATLPGEFPNTVAASDKYKLICVGLTGATAGIACAPYSVTSGIGAVDALRPFALGQSTPPAGPLNTVSQVFFSGDEMTLFATVKGNPTVNNTGYLAAFPVQNTRSSCQVAPSVAAQGVTSSPAGTAVLFGSSPIKGSTNLFVTDASFGGAVLSIDGTTDKASTVGKGVIAGQAATCWVAISPATNTAFVADVGVDRLIEMSLTDGSIQGAPIDLTAASGGDPGLTDLRAAGSFVYALSPGNGTTDAAVTVVNALTRQPVQHVSVASLGLTKSAQGMAILV